MVTIASGKLKTNPKTRPMSHPGQGSCTQPMLNPIANRLANAPSSAVRLSRIPSGRLRVGVIRSYNHAMSAAEIIREIEQLPPEQRAEVVRFARQFESELVRRLSPEELGQLAERLIAAKSDAEAEVIKQAMVEGFYGTQVHA